MQSTFFAVVCLLIPVNNLLAQAPDQFLPSTLIPRVGVTVLSDGRPTNQQTGIKIDTKQIRFKAWLDTKSNEFFNNFQSELLIKNIEAVLARNGRQIARINVVDGHLPSNLVQQAQPDDHLLFKFTLIAQRKNGESVPLPEQPIYNFSIRK